MKPGAKSVEEPLQPQPAEKPAVKNTEESQAEKPSMPEKQDYKS